MLIDVPQLLYVVPQRLLGVSETVLPRVAPYLEAVARRLMLAERLSHRIHATRAPHELLVSVSLAPPWLYRVVDLPTVLLDHGVRLIDTARKA